MKNNPSLHITIAVLIIVSFFFSSCGSKNNTVAGPEISKVQESHIPDLFVEEFFVEKGSDLDSSYISFRGIRKNNDTLEIQATSWEVIEYGLFLSHKHSNKTAIFTVMGMCGTVFQRTWKKVTLHEWMSKAETDTLQELTFTNYRNTLTIAKNTVSH